MWLLSFPMLSNPRALPTVGGRPTSGGFTVIELLVTSFIIALVTGLVLIRYSAFNGTVLLTNQAYQIALDIRQMQVFALGERVGPGSDRNEFGVHFERGQAVFTLFENQDTETKPLFDTGDTIFAESAVDPRFEIQGIFDDASTPNSYDEASISFRRPNYDALFCLLSTSGDTSCAPGSSASEIRIVIADDDDASVTKTILVTTTGQISVE